MDWGLVGLGAGMIAAVWMVRRGWQARQRRRVGGGFAVRFAVRITGVSPPYPTPGERGGSAVRDRISVGRDVLRVDLGRAAGAIDLSETGLKVLRLRAPVDDEHAHGEDLALACVDGTGIPVTLFAPVGGVGLLREALDQRSLPDDPQPARRLPSNSRWSPAQRQPLALLGLGVIASAVTALALATSISVETPVQSLDGDGLCSVAWVDPRDGAPHGSAVDCVDDVGQTTTIYSLAGPLRGAALDESTPVAWLGIDAVLLATGGWWLWRVRPRSRPPRGAIGAWPPPATQPSRGTTRTLETWELQVPAGPQGLSWTTLSSLADRRARLEGWGQTDAAPSTAAGTGHSASYALFLDASGDLEMLLFTRSGDSPPTWIVRVEPGARHMIPPTGTVTLQGTLEAGETIGVTVCGRPITVDGPLYAADAQSTRYLVHATDLTEEDMN